MARKILIGVLSVIEVALLALVLRTKDPLSGEFEIAMLMLFGSMLLSVVMLRDTSVLEILDRTPVHRQYAECELCYKPRPRWFWPDWNVVIYNKHRRALLCPECAHCRIQNADGTWARIVPSWQDRAVMAVVALVTTAFILYAALR